MGHIGCVCGFATVRDLTALGMRGTVLERRMVSFGNLVPWIQVRAGISGTCAGQKFWGHPMSSRWLGTALAVMLAASAAVPASAASLLELNFYLSGPRYDAVYLPPCDDPQALGRITARFAEKEGKFWSSSLTIVGYDKVRETAYRPRAPHTIPRRFCTAVAFVSDGFKHPIYYSIGEDTGMIGANFGVEWCVLGLDRNWAYNPSCKMARP